MIITIFQKPDMKIRVAKAGINYPWVHGVDSMPLYPYPLTQLGREFFYTHLFIG
jgi:hypothetical protein